MKCSCKFKNKTFWIQLTYTQHSFITEMISTRLYLGIATLGVLVAPIISFPQDIKFGDSPTTFGDSNDDNVKPKINGRYKEIKIVLIWSGNIDVRENRYSW